MSNPAPYEDFVALRIARDGHILTITLDSPPLNAMTPDIHTELARVFGRVHTDRDTRVVVLTGAGDRAFSAGGNLDLIAENIDNHARWIRMTEEARDIVLGMINCDTPIIARVNGHAIGMGASLALAADMAIMVEEAKIGDSHVVIGLVAGDGGSLLWPLMVGLNRAKQYLLTGEPLLGREAAAIGLVNVAVPSAELDETVALWAGRIAKLPPPAVKGTKRALNALLRQHAQATAELHLGFETTSHLSKDHHEAIDALRAKRPANYTGG
jgi:enoyl-CoA hydratase